MLETFARTPDVAPFLEPDDFFLLECLFKLADSCMCILKVDLQLAIFLFYPSLDSFFLVESGPESLDMVVDY